MKHKTLNTTRFLIALCILSIIAASDIAQQQTPQPPPPLSFNAPSGWVSEKPQSASRVAQFTLPRVSGDKEDATVILYYFNTGGGGVQANLDRWVSQFQQPDGSSSQDKAKIDKLDVNGLKVTEIDLAGIYIAEMAPGSTNRFHEPNFRMRAAVIDTGKNPFYLRMLGPAKTVTKWNASFDEFVKSLQMKTM
ncbi:MAG TPA: hypothetical protein VFC63_27700 [Blastocatellia bacterium]|nr:hypothetical protein [Blastocatellia bacterium]